MGLPGLTCWMTGGNVLICLPKQSRLLSSVELFFSGENVLVKGTTQDVVRILGYFGKGYRLNLRLGRLGHRQNMAIVSRNPKDLRISRGDLPIKEL